MSTLGHLVTAVNCAGSPWLRFAAMELGQTELEGRKQNERVLDYQKAVGNPAREEVAWCSAFANWCMLHAGVHGTGMPNARSWLSWGEALKAPEYGCVTVFSRPPEAWQGHVAFYIGSKPGSIAVLGGNQSSPGSPDGVCIKDYPQSRLLGYRWPIGFARARKA
jgi:uncharacterized protein (TIGR02594 family)